eukprot:jgi/Bigna1/146189/aug1.110_g20897
MASDPDETKKLNVVENTKNDGEKMGLIGELKGESSPDLKRCQTFDGNALKLPKMLPVLSRAKRYVDLLAEARFVPFEEDEKGKYLHFRKEMMLMGFGVEKLLEELKQPSDDLKRAATIPPQEEKKALQVQEENKKALSSKLEGFDGNVEDLSVVSLRCPEPSCNREIKEDEVKKVVNEGTFAKYKYSFHWRTT